jgi:hypothetical protein
MGFRRTFSEQVYMQFCNEFGTALVDGKFPTTYISMSEFEFGVFVVKLGTLDSAIDVQVYQAKTAAGGSAKVLTGAAKTDILATDDGYYMTIEFRTSQLDIANDFAFVSLDVASAAGSNDYADIIFLGLGARREPVDQPDAYYDAIVL